MKRLTAVLLAGAMMLGLTACGRSQKALGNEKQTTEAAAQEKEINSVENKANTDEEESLQVDQNNVLVAYFAYSENMGDTSGMSVDAITSASVGPTKNTEGNLQVMVQVIQEKTGADACLDIS